MWVTRWIPMAAVLLASYQLLEAHEGHNHHEDTEQSNADWTHKSELKKFVGVDFKWNATDPDYVLMEMSTKTKGYVSVGFCPEWRNSMEGCDLVIGWVDDVTGEAHLRDYHAVGNSVPIIDISQDYTLISGKQDGFLTTITFKRRWDTGDDNDANLKENKVQLIWSWHPEDVDINGGVIKPHDKNTRGHTKTMISLKSPPEDNRIDFNQSQSGEASSQSLSCTVISLILASVLAMAIV